MGRSVESNLVPTTTAKFAKHKIQITDQRKNTLACLFHLDSINREPVFNWIASNSGSLTASAVHSAVSSLAVGLSPIYYQRPPIRNYGARKAAAV